MFDVRNPRFFFDAPVVIDAALRPRLDAFDGKIPAAPWSWFVQTTRSLSDHDFAVLTGVDAAGAESSSQQ